MNAPVPTLLSSNSTVTQPLYEQACRAIALCASIDDAKEIHDRAAALAVYARQRDDTKILVWVQEIKLRASIRIGEIYRDLPKAQRGPRGAEISAAAGVQSKLEVVEEAGLSRTVALRLQRIAGPREEIPAKAGRAAADLYFAEARDAMQPATQEGLEARVTAAVQAALGPEHIERRARDLRKAKQAEKAERRAAREEKLGERTRVASAALGAQRYGVILADPEWDFSVWSPETGMDRSAANHYPTSPLSALQARGVASIAADDCLLALWATVPMIPEAYCVMDAWGFARFDRDPGTGFLTIDKSQGRYVSSAAWVKYKPGSGMGMGYWFRVDHEVLLIATRGNPPAPSGEDRVRSVFDVPASRVHSEKPDLVCEILEAYFPSLPKIELNRRGPARPGWDAWGNEAGSAP